MDNLLLRRFGFPLLEDTEKRPKKAKKRRIRENEAMLTRSEVEAAWEHVYIKLGKVSLKTLCSYLDAIPSDIVRLLPRNLIVDKNNNVVDKGITPKSVRPPALAA